MNGASLQPCNPKAIQPGSHFTGRPCGESHSQAGGSLICTNADGVRNPVGDRSGLARPCPCEHHDRLIKQGGDPSLFRIKRVEYLVSHQLIVSALGDKIIL